MYTIRENDGGWELVAADGTVLATVAGQGGYDELLAQLAGILTEQRASLAMDGGGDDGLLPEGWVAPIAFLSEPTGDGRDFSETTWTWRDPNVSPVPLMLHTETDMGHFGAQLAGFATAISESDGTGTMSGRFYDNEEGRAFRDMLLGGRRFGVSVDPGGGTEVEFRCIETDEDGWCSDEELVFISYEVIGLTGTPFPGFARAHIILDGAASAPAEEPAGEEAAASASASLCSCPTPRSVSTVTEEGCGCGVAGVAGATGASTRARRSRVSSAAVAPQSAEVPGQAASGATSAANSAASTSTTLAPEPGVQIPNAVPGPLLPSASRFASGERTPGNRGSSMPRVFANESASQSPGTTSLTSSRSRATSAPSAASPSPTNPGRGPSPTPISTTATRGTSSGAGFAPHATERSGCSETMRTRSGPRPTTSTGLLAAGYPISPPSAWFNDPQLDLLTPLSIEDDGRVFGHIAPWQMCHTGFQGECVTTPRSLTNYAYFRTGEVACDDGSRVASGRLTVGGGHADMSLSFRGATEHYDDVGAAFADVAAGEDAFGVWVAGALRPGVTEETLRVIRASPPSGDWRPIGAGLELVAACSVNSGGFPIARVASGGRILALVAAGAPVMRALAADPTAERLARVERQLASLQASATAPARAKLRAIAEAQARARLRDMASV